MYRNEVNTHHLVTSTNKHRHCPTIGAFLDDKHLISCCTEAELAHNSGMAEFLGCEVFEAGNDATLSGDSNQLSRGEKCMTAKGKKRKLIPQSQVLQPIVQQEVHFEARGDSPHRQNPTDR